MEKTKNTTRYQGYDVSWSDLNHDVLYLVMMRLGVADFLAFKRVCKSWRSLALSNKKPFMASRPPMSICISTRVNKSDHCCYLDNFDGRRFKTILPHSVGRKCVGLTCGYIILFRKKTRDFWLVNPITRHQLHFPRVPFDVKIYPYLRVRAILVFSPSISAWVFVVIHLNTFNMWFSIMGKGVWNHVSSFFPIIELHALKGKLYMLNRHIRYEYLLYEIRFGQHPELTLLETKNFPKSNRPPLFISSGENLYVMRNNALKLYDFHELDFGEMEWVSCDSTKHEYAFFYSSEHLQICDLKRELWGDSWLQHERYVGVNKIWEDGFDYTTKIWYFPHDCFNVNLID